MEKVRERIYLAALLHDIGKFYQRADTGRRDTSKHLSDEVKKCQSTFLPSAYKKHKESKNDKLKNTKDKNRKENYTHVHCLWTAQFIKNYECVFKDIVKADFNELSDQDNFVNIAAGHHLRPEKMSALGQIIKNADCLSAGMDRDSPKALKDDEDQYTTGWDAFKKRRMTSILEGIGMEQNVWEDKINWKHLPVGKISMQKSFPEDGRDYMPDYSTIWNEFITDFELIQSNDFRAFSETLLQLLFKYTCNIPASTVNFRDVSLYDHAKTTAAIAVCLYDYSQSENETATDPFLLVGADFSGIQNYIYQIISKYAGKNLKGRSFFLRILSDAVLRYLLQELNLFQANVIYNSGGGFYLLAPNTKRVRDQLQKATEKIGEQFFADFSTSLSVVIDSISLSKDDLYQRKGCKLGNKWHDLFNRLKKKKAHKYDALIVNKYNSFFTPLLQGANTKRDQITGEEFLPDEKEYPIKEISVKENTGLQIELGKKLRDMEFMVVAQSNLSGWENVTCINPAHLGYYYYIVTNHDWENLSKTSQAEIKNVTVIRYNNEDFVSSMKWLNNTYQFDFYGGNKFEGQTFEDMTDYKQKRFSRLGVLRMDVDNLGEIFHSGIKPERSTLSRFATLSRSLDYFFSGYLNTIWNEVDPDRKKSVIIYSGGDDVFIVGSWEVCIEFAKRIRKDFHEFTCHNSKFSISGGIAIVSTKFPIIKGAAESDAEVIHAKNHQVWTQSKNSLSFMDFPLNWNCEFPQVEILKEKIAKLINSEEMPASFISKVQNHAANAEIENHIIQNYKTYWLLTYDLARMKERIENQSCVKIIENCIKEVCGDDSHLNGEQINTNYHLLELWAFAARWAELETRIDKEI
jgi:CRISPR-associated protein Csm1